MRKSIKTALFTLCAGAVVAGVGAGVAFMEYSSMRIEALPQTTIGNEVTASGELSIPSDADVSFSGPYDFSDIVSDDGVPEGTVLVSARASGAVERIAIEGPDIVIEEVYGEGPYGLSAQSESRKVAYISVYPVVDSISPLDYREVVLEGLKNGVLYRTPSEYDGFSVEVRMNPTDAARVR